MCYGGSSGKRWLKTAGSRMVGLETAGQGSRVEMVGLEMHRLHSTCEGQPSGLRQ